MGSSKTENPPQGGGCINRPMEPWLIAVVLRPLGALALFLGAYLIGRVVWHFIPPGRVRDVLYDREFGRLLQAQHPWTFFFAFLAAMLGFSGFAYGIAWVIAGPF